MNIFVYVSDRNQALREWLENGVQAVEGAKLVSNPKEAQLFLVGEEPQLRLLYGLGIAQKKQVTFVVRKGDEPVNASSYPENLHTIQLSDENPVRLAMSFLKSFSELLKKLSAVPA
jgi:hypothetical protein